MLFNSFEFAWFFALFYLGYLALSRFHKAQNAWLLVASYFFYGWWDWRFLSLLWGLTLWNYFAAYALSKTDDESKRRAIVAWAVVGNLAVLGFFKYFNFFQENVVRTLQAIGLEAHPLTLSIILPVGISFFVFQGLGYVIDVYRGKKGKKIDTLFDFAVFKAFFPQLVAGPIERSTGLLPQVQRPRIIRPDMIIAGVGLIVWGLYKKVVIADNLAPIANIVFENYQTMSNGDLTLGVLAFTFQIYCDFSAYSDIARGLAFLMGIELMLNFRLPYFASDPSDFWRRWHISLSSWLRDYLYVPLGGNRGGSLMTARNLMLTMVLGGLWHGAAWTFVVWGAYHGAILIGQRIVAWIGKLIFGARQKLAATLLLPVRIPLMFVLAVIGWVFFRATSMDQALYILGHAGFEMGVDTVATASRMAWLIVPLVAYDALQAFRESQSDIPRWPVLVRGLVYGAAICVMMVWAAREQTEFIYFAF